MNAKSLSTVLVLTTSLVCAALAAAVDTPLATPPAIGQKGLKPEVAPLKGPLKLDASALATPPPAVQSRDALDRTYDRFRRAHENTLTARNNFLVVRDACRTRSFSIEDQRQAGCQLSDTVAQCNRKLGNWCPREASAAWRAANQELHQATDALKAAADSYFQGAVRLIPGTY